MRWRTRIRSGRPPSLKAGPKPVEPLDMNALEKQITCLHHVRQRTMGTGELYREISDRISRRDFQALVSVERQNQKRDNRQSQNRIQWHVPGMVWAFDDSEYLDPGFLRKNHIHSIRDLASKSTFPPIAGFQKADGERIAPYLENLFEEYGPPLFLKRDNGSNLNHHDVDKMLAEWMVMPFNSPPYYPQYNGSIEQTQSELKNELKATICCTPRELLLQVQIAVNTLNHKHRPCLNGKTSCQVFAKSKSRMKPFNRRKRKEIFERILYYTMHLANDVSKYRRFDDARRYAIQLWLLEHGYISMKNYEMCYPIFSTIFAHN
jgi:hypothetical protein